MHRQTNITVDQKSTQEQPFGRQPNPSGECRFVGEGAMRRLPSISVAILALQSITASSVSAKPVRWSRNGHLYEAIYVPIGIDWANAKIHAQALGCGWYLATLTSSAENAFVFGLIANRPELFVSNDFGVFGPWIGGFQKSALDEPAGNWR